MMAEFERREAEKRDAERSKNDLEAYIISTGATLEEGTFDEVCPSCPQRRCTERLHSSLDTSFCITIRCLEVCYSFCPESRVSMWWLRYT